MPAAARIGCPTWYFKRDPSKTCLKTKVELQSGRQSPRKPPSGWKPSTASSKKAGPERAAYLLSRLIDAAAKYGVENAPQTNPRPTSTQFPWKRKSLIPGDRETGAPHQELASLERKWRWWCAANKTRSRNRRTHLHLRVASYTDRSWPQSFLSRAAYDDQPGDFVYFQGHASPGTYARAVPRRTHQRKAPRKLPPRASRRTRPLFLSASLVDGRTSGSFPTVSMGLGPINAIYQARFMRYLENRAVIPVTKRKIWAFPW